MKKVKGIVAVVLACTMLFGSAIAVNAASNYHICRKCGNNTALYGYNTHQTCKYCSGDIISYVCDTWYCAGYDECTAGHLQ